MDAVDIATIGGNAAVVVTLIALVWQTRLSQRTQALIAAQTQSSGLNEFYLALAENPELGRVYRQGRRDPEVLNSDEEVQFFYACVLWFGYQESTFMQCNTGLIASAYFDAWDRALREDLADPGFAWYWRQEGDYYDTDFRDYVSAAIPLHPELP